MINAIKGPIANQRKNRSPSLVRVYPSTGPEKLLGKTKGLVQLSPQLYGGWGFLSS